jgi:hypothetical protein
MEKIFAFLLTLLITASILYLFIGFVILPVIKLYKENARLKR